MFTNKKGETLISVIVGMLIIGLIMSSVMVILSSNYTAQEDLNRNNKLLILQSNTNNILRKLDINGVLEGELFYIYKNNNTKDFVFFTGSINEKYKYINENGDLVENTGSYDGDIFTRILYLQKNDTTYLKPTQIIKADIRELIRK